MKNIKEKIKLNKISRKKKGESRMFLYMYLNNNGEIIYAGKTKRTPGRRDYEHEHNTKTPFDSNYSDAAEFLVCEIFGISEEMLDIYESALINQTAPKYNIMKMKNKKEDFANIENLDFDFFTIWITPERLNACA